MREADFFIDSFLAGVCMIAAYDMLRMVRRVIPHNTFWVSAEDFIYWILCGIFIFRMILFKNDGSLRIYTILGIFTGILYYLLTISSISLKYIVGVMKKILHFVQKMFFFKKKRVQEKQKEREQEAYEKKQKNEKI